MLYQLLAEYIREKDLPAETLAAGAGIAPETLAAMLAGAVPIMAEDYYRICRALGVDIDNFTTQG